jgi:hypothetical protein
MVDHIFISYSSKNKNIADAVCHKLEERKMKCWIAPRDILPGANYAEELINAIDESKLFVLIFSKDSNQSQHVLRECERAVSHGIPIIPFRIEDVLPGAALQYFIGPQHWLDAITAPCDAHINRLADTVNILLTQEDLTKKSTGEMLAEAEALAIQRQQQVTRMRRTSIVLAAAVVVVAAIGGGWFVAQQMSQASMNLVPYTNAAAGFSMSVPQGWQKVERAPTHDDPTAVTLYLPTNNKSEQIYVFATPAGGTDFDKVTTTNLDSAQTLQDNKKIQMQESSESSFAGQTGYKIVYTINDLGLKRMQIWTVKNDTVYQFNYDAQPQHYNDYIATIQNMADSFKIT